MRGEREQAGLALQIASTTAHGLVLMRDNDQSARRPHGERREAIAHGFEAARARGARTPAVLALAIECIEAWALADAHAWARRATSLDDALTQAAIHGAVKVFVLGGGELYREALAHFRCTEVHYTRVDAEFPGADVTFPELEAAGGWTIDAHPTSHHDNGFDYRIERWRRFPRFPR